MGDVTRYDIDGREWEIVEIKDGDYVRHIDHVIYLNEVKLERDAFRVELAALREELANAEFEREAVVSNRDRVREKLGLALGESMNHAIDTLQQRLTAAEQRNAAILGKQTKCKECGSDALFWFSSNTNTSGIVEGRLRTNEVTCTFVLGCADCSATIKTVRADTIADRMTAALKPTESGASEIAKKSLSFENQRIETVRFKCLACGGYHEGSGNLPCPKMSPMSGVKP
jgi:hypothetical protein